MKIKPNRITLDYVIKIGKVLDEQNVSLKNRRIRFHDGNKIVETKIDKLIKKLMRESKYGRVNDKKSMR